MSNSTSTSTSKAHILVYPLPTAGHIIPLLHLTHRLLIHGLSVTILITPNNLPLLDPLLSFHHSSSLLPIVFPSPKSSINQSKNTKLGPIAEMMLELHDLHYPLLLQWFQSHQSPPVAILSDFLLGWTHEFASEVGVASVVFSPTGAFGLSTFFTLWQDLPKTDDPNDENSLIKFHDLPNCPALPWYQVPPLYKEPDPEFIRNVAHGDLASWAIVLNTSTQLERVYIEHIKNQVGHNRVWAVGPVLAEEDDLGRESSSVPCHKLMTWLDAREDGSVVYVCFGSRGVLTRKQMDALAPGLEKSGVNFIWCMKSQNVKLPNERRVADDWCDIPDGFEDRVAGKGYIIKEWAPQVDILRHRAVGVFLTHCGWNSTLEGIASGVVMLTWPMRAEQFLNAKLLVEQLGVGIGVGEGTQKIPDSTELARLFIKSFDESIPERVKVKEFRDAVMRGVAKGGSSYTDLDEFVKSLNERA